MNHYFDIAMLGAGPAAVVLANTLVSYGYRVLMLNRARSYPAIEGLSERALMGLRYVNCEHALTQLSNRALRQAYWNGTAFPGNHEWLIDRVAFDQALRADARAAGVELIDAYVSRYQCTADGLWQISLTQSKYDNMFASFIVDARGRSAKHQPTMLQSGPATTALGRRWRLPTATPPRTCLVPFANGWLWYGQHVPQTALVQIFVSSENKRLPARKSLSAYYQQCLDTIPEIHDYLHNSEPESPVFARFAQAQFDRDLIGTDYAKVGDAAFAIDPLSGHGLFEAISGALALAPCINTLLARPVDQAIAMQFYRQKISDDFIRMARIGRDFYRMEQRWNNALFWQQRQHWPDAEPAHSAANASAASIAQRPVSNAGFIEQRDVIISADHTRGIWQVAGVALVPLLKYLRLQQNNQGTQSDVLRAFAEQEKQREQDVQIALQWLLTRGLLKPSQASH